MYMLGPMWRPFESANSYDNERKFFEAHVSGRRARTNGGGRRRRVGCAAEARRAAVAFASEADGGQEYAEAAGVAVEEASAVGARTRQTASLRTLRCDDKIDAGDLGDCQRYSARMRVSRRGRQPAICQRLGVACCGVRRRQWERLIRTGRERARHCPGHRPASACNCCTAGRSVETPATTQRSDAFVSQAVRYLGMYATSSALRKPLTYKNAQCCNKGGTQKWRIWQDGGSNEPVKERVGHWEFPTKQKSFVSVNRDKVLLKLVYRTVKMVGLDHLPAGPQVHLPNLPKDVVAFRGELGRGTLSWSTGA
eukprot:1679120-Pleurochrysis_carterae.AAC.8